MEFFGSAYTDIWGFIIICLRLKINGCIILLIYVNMCVLIKNIHPFVGWFVG